MTDIEVIIKQLQAEQAKKKRKGMKYIFITNEQKPKRGKKK